MCEEDLIAMNEETQSSQWNNSFWLNYCKGQAASAMISNLLVSAGARFDYVGPDGSPGTVIDLRIGLEQGVP